MQYETLIRFSCFIGTLSLMMFWERMSPRRRLSVPKRMRWLSNIGLLALGTMMLRAVFPAAAVGVAAVAADYQWGLFYRAPFGQGATILLSLLCLDLAIYVHHRLFHAVPILWRLHKLHHTDLDFDVTTGLRFHPLEILLSMGFKIAMILVLGVPVIAVLIFEVILNTTAMFNHGNIDIPIPLDRLLRILIVTPDMHRVHHSTIPQETNRNFGFNLPWWDYLLGTSQPQPAAGHQQMPLGLTEYQKDLRVTQLHWMLILPFLKHQPGQLPDR